MAIESKNKTTSILIYGPMLLGMLLPPLLLPCAAEKETRPFFYNLASNEMTTLSSTWWYAPKVVHIFLEHLRAFSFWSFFCHWNYIHECKFKVYGPFMGLVTK